jgi:transglutaminase-like putative cysteine protease
VRAFLNSFENMKQALTPDLSLRTGRGGSVIIAGMTATIPSSLIMGFICMTTTFAAAATTQPTGASLAFTSHDPVTNQAIALLEEGKFAEAQTLLATDDGHASAEVTRAREEAKEIIRRVRRDYSLTAPQLVEKLKSSIPNVTDADIERWRSAGELQHRIIDGKVAYFRREPSNLFRFSEDAKKRRDGAQSKKAGAEDDKAKFELHQHLAEVIAEAEKSGKTEVLPVRHRITFSVTVPGNTRGAKAGSVIRAWLPFPQEYRQQRDVKLIRSAPEGGRIAPNAVEGNPVTGAPQRSVYFEHRLTDPARPVKFEIEFEYTSSAYYPILDDAKAKPLSSPGDFSNYMGARPPHIAFSPELRETVDKIVADETNPLVKARKIFHHLDREIRYCAEMEYSTIPSFSEKALSTGQGDCGVQTMLLITMLRAAGIPARWQSGWQTKPGQTNMHDWAEFYVEPWGWLPIDQSYGRRVSDDPKIREFYFGHQDAYRMIVNRDYGTQFHPPKASLRSEPADFQIGEVELDGRNLFYDEWDWDIAFQ